MPTEPITWPKQCPSCGHKTVGTTRWCDRRGACHECEELWWEGRIRELETELKRPCLVCDVATRLHAEALDDLDTIKVGFLAYKDIDTHECAGLPIPNIPAKQSAIVAAAKLCNQTENDND